MVRRICRVGPAPFGLQLVLPNVVLNRIDWVVMTIKYFVRDFVQRTLLRAAKSTFSDEWTRIVLVQWVDVCQHRFEVFLLCCRCRRQRLRLNYSVLCFNVLADSTPRTDERWFPVKGGGNLVPSKAGYAWKCNISWRLSADFSPGRCRSPVSVLANALALFYHYMKGFVGRCSRP